MNASVKEGLKVLLNPAAYITSRLAGDAFQALGFEGLGKSVLGSGFDNQVTSLINSQTNAGLTGQQIAQNEYTASREDTRFQRQVEDMKAAGLNPAMMYGSGASAPSVAASASAPSGGLSLSDMLELATLPAKIANIKASTQSIKAGTEKTKSETVGQDISNQFAAKLNQSALDSQSVMRELSRHQIHEVDSKIDYMEQNRQNLIVDMEKSVKEMSVMDAQISRIDTQNLESMADIVLKRVSASRLVSLLPYEQLYMSAKTDAERGAAAASFAQAAWQNGLIDNGYVETTCKALDITNSINEVKAALTNPNYDYDSMVLDKAGRAIMATVSAFLNPIKGIVSF